MEALHVNGNILVTGNLLKPSDRRYIYIYIFFYISIYISISISYSLSLFLFFLSSSHLIFVLLYWILLSSRIKQHFVEVDGQDQLDRIKAVKIYDYELRDGKSADGTVKRERGGNL